MGGASGICGDHSWILTAGTTKAMAQPIGASFFFSLTTRHREGATSVGNGESRSTPRFHRGVPPVAGSGSPRWMKRAGQSLNKTNAERYVPSIGVTSNTVNCKLARQRSSKRLHNCWSALLSHRHALAAENYLAICVCRQPKAPLAELWPSPKYFA